MPQHPDQQTVILCEKKHEYGDVWTFVFEKEKPFIFTAGMYAHMRVPDLPEGVKAVRDLSIASAPSEEKLMFSVHVREESPFKQKLHSLKIGESVEIFKIKGSFTLSEKESTPVVLVAGGIGITPYRSMLIESSLCEKVNDLTLLHVANGGYLYQEELSKLPYQAHHTTSAECGEILHTLIENKLGADFYVSGPTGFVESIVQKITAGGVSEEHIHTDLFHGYETILE